MQAMRTTSTTTPGKATKGKPADTVKTHTHDHTDKTRHTHAHTHHPTPQEVVTIDEDDAGDDSNKDSNTEDSNDDDMDDDMPHCHVNFVRNVTYPLIHGPQDKQWGTASFIDPAPPVPKELQAKYKAGDYLLTCGANLKVKDKKIIWSAGDDYILSKDWESMDADVTGEDLAEYNDEEFLLWFQCVKPPKVKPAKPAPKAKPKKGGRKR